MEGYVYTLFTEVRCPNCGKDTRFFPHSTFYDADENMMGSYIISGTRNPCKWCGNYFEVIIEEIDE